MVTAKRARISNSREKATLELEGKSSTPRMLATTYGIDNMLG